MFQARVAMPLPCLSRLYLVNESDTLNSRETGEQTNSRKRKFNQYIGSDSSSLALELREQTSLWHRASCLLQHRTLIACSEGGESTHNVLEFLVDFELDRLRVPFREARVLLLPHQLKQLEQQQQGAASERAQHFLPVRAIARAAYHLGVRGGVDLPQRAGPALQDVGVEEPLVGVGGAGGGSCRRRRWRGRSGGLAAEGEDAVRVRDVAERHRYCARGGHGGRRSRRPEQAAHGGRRREGFLGVLRKRRRGDVGEERRRELRGRGLFR
jgi:hypothetical protein